MFNGQYSKPYTQFHRYIQNTFGADFYNWLFMQASDPYQNKEGKWAIDFKDMLYNFSLSAVAEGWRLTLLNDGQPFEDNIVEVPPDSTPEEMVLTFHALKSTMIVALDDYLFSKIREERNREVAGPDPELLLPNTMIRLADWECQLILEFVKSGCEPKSAISKAKSLIYVQLNTDGAAPGDLSLFDKCKSSVDQK